MFSGLVGESVTVISYGLESKDEMGIREKVPVETEVAGVAVFPGSGKDVGEDNRPDGVIVAYTLHFPKTFTGDLTNCDVIVRGHRCSVIGHPDREPQPCPTAYNMTVEVSDVEG